MAKNQKLELQWIGKDQRPRLEPRILLEEPELSYHADHRVGANDIFDNRLIFGDNLLALKALEQEFAGKIRCIYIDPPYNTGAAFELYDDGIEHSLWLALMRDRLEILRRLLTDEGSIWINLDDTESHYCKVLCDEVFGRNNFIANVIWEKSDSPRMDAEFFSSRHDHIIAFAKDKSRLRLNRLNSGDLPAHYDRVDKVGRPYYLKPLRAMGGDDSREARPSMYFPMTAPDGTEILPIRKDKSAGRWRWGKERTETDAALIEWVKGRTGWSPYYRVYGGEENLRPPETIWTHSDVGSNRTSKAEIKALFDNEKSFETPKPERLLQRVIEIASDPGDWVLDSFGGSGTTGAVGHKLRRHWIMVELGEHARTHIVPRLRKVIDGADSGGATASSGWTGGGGFRFFKLAPSLIAKDKWGNPVINKTYNPAMLAEAVCKLEGFRYAPTDVYWQHGYSTERDFIYVTTQKLSREQLQTLSDEVGDERTLLVCCAAFRAKVDAFPNLTVKKIPHAVLARCEWGHDDYSLQIKNLPAAPDLDPDYEPLTKSQKRKAKSTPTDTMSLFDTAQTT